MARNQFVVPQFLDIEPKIFGPITLRQFVIMMAVILIEFILYRIFLNLIVLLALGIPILAAGVTFAFAKVNGQPFHYVVLSIIQTIRRPGVRVWDKSLTDEDIRHFMKKDTTPPPAPPSSKRPLERSRLSELALIVNTGGVYSGEDQL
ncbi:PrgI family protein [Patescibacteria group bacterium]|nr:PrgI family protein [Patescibacteria group bacterium]